MGILQARILENILSPGDLPNPGIESGSPALQEDSLPNELSALSIVVSIAAFQMSYQGSPNDFKSNQIRESIPDNAKAIQRNYP